MPPDRPMDHTLCAAGPPKAHRRAERAADVLNAPLDRDKKLEIDDVARALYIHNSCISERALKRGRL